MHPLYPSSESGAAISALGSFLRENDASGLYEATVLAATDGTGNFLRRQEETLLACDRATVPVLARTGWRNLKLRRDDAEARQLAMPRYGSAGDYGDGGIYGQADTSVFAWPLPPNWVDVPFLASRISYPVRTWIDGVDFVVENGSLVFRDDPFLAEGAPIDTDADDSEILSLWVCGVGVDERLAANHFGYVFALRGGSTPAFRRAVNAAYDAASSGSADLDVRGLLAGLAGLPMASGDETVSFVDGRLVVTDAAVHRVPVGAAITAAAGDSLVAGDIPCDALRFFDWEEAAAAAPADLALLSLPRDTLGRRYAGGLAFLNGDTPAAVGELDGRTTFEFPVLGRDGDADLFWEETHARGVAAGLTLAEALDERVNQVGQPTEVDLPATVNPMRFLLEKTLRSRAFVIRTRTAAAAAACASAAVRAALPPWFMPLVCVEIAMPAETLGITTRDSFQDDLVANQRLLEDGVGRILEDLSPRTLE